MYSSRTVGVGYVHRRHSNTVSMCKIWACTRLTCHHQWCKQHAHAKVTKLWRACSWGFTRVAIHLVVQMELCRWKVVCFGQLTLRWTLDCWQRLSRWAHHNVTRQQSLKQKSSQFSGGTMSSCSCIATFTALFIAVAEKSALQNNTHTDRQMDKHDNYRMPWGSAHRGIIKWLWQLGWRHSLVW